MRYSLPTRERVEAAIRLHQHTNPGVAVSVSAICKAASVNRANLYAHYPDLLEAIRVTWSNKRRGARKVASVALSVQNTTCIDKELLYLCLELRAEVEALNKRFALGTEPNSKRNKKP